MGVEEQIRQVQKELFHKGEVPSRHAPTPGEQTLNLKEHKQTKTPISIYSKLDSEQQFRIILSKKIHTDNSRKQLVL